MLQSPVPRPQGGRGPRPAPIWLCIASLSLPPVVLAKVLRFICFSLGILISFALPKHIILHMIFLCKGGAGTGDCSTYACMRARILVGDHACGCECVRVCMCVCVNNVCIYDCFCMYAYVRGC